VKEEWTMTPESKIQTKPRLSIEEYFALGDDKNTELDYGEVVLSPRPSADHQDLMIDLATLLKRWAKSHNLGRVTADIDMVLSAEDAVAPAPDLVFIAAGRDCWKGSRLYGAADLAVEILSPTERPTRTARKFADYEKYGVHWYWFIDPFSVTLDEYELVKGRLTCRSEVGADDLFEPGVFPGLKFRLKPLLEGDLKAAVEGEAAGLV